MVPFHLADDRPRTQAFSHRTIHPIWVNGGKFICGKVEWLTRIFLLRHELHANCVLIRCRLRGSSLDDRGVVEDPEGWELEELSDWGTGSSCRYLFDIADLVTTGDQLSYSKDQGSWWWENDGINVCSLPVLYIDCIGFSCIHVKVAAKLKGIVPIFKTTSVILTFNLFKLLQAHQSARPTCWVVPPGSENYPSQVIGSPSLQIGSKSTPSSFPDFFCHF